MSTQSISSELAALRDAIDRAGGQTRLATAIGKSQGHISVWLKRGRCAPDAVLAIESATGVSRHVLRPDVFGESKSDEVAA